jgi:hypothetical protein
MSELTPPEASPSLAARVEARVNNARVIVAGQTKRVGHRAFTDSRSPKEIRESQSLQRVFRDLGMSYRRYRSQTGSRVVPGLRDAAYNFRAEPSLTSLVAVAAYLDELDLLS